jgi:hypothetical protein
MKCNDKRVPSLTLCIRLWGGAVQRGGDLVRPITTRVPSEPNRGRTRSCRRRPRGARQHSRRRSRRGAQVMEAGLSFGRVPPIEPRVRRSLRDLWAFRRPASIGSASADLEPTGRDRRPTAGGCDEGPIRSFRSRLRRQPSDQNDLGTGISEDADDAREVSGHGPPPRLAAPPRPIDTPLENFASVHLAIA